MKPLNWSFRLRPTDRGTFEGAIWFEFWKRSTSRRGRAWFAELEDAKLSYVNATVTMAIVASEDAANTTAEMMSPSKQNRQMLASGVAAVSTSNSCVHARLEMTWSCIGPSLGRFAPTLPRRSDARCEVLHIRPGISSRRARKTGWSKEMGGSRFRQKLGRPRKWRGDEFGIIRPLAGSTEHPGYVV